MQNGRKGKRSPQLPTFPTAKSPLYPCTSPRPSRLPHHYKNPPTRRPPLPALLFSFPAALLLSTPMADCYALEADDFHRRWLPREIFADIGIADPEPLAAVAATAPPVPAAAVEELAAQLAGMLGAGAGTGDKAESSPKRSPSPPPPSAPAAAAAPFPPVSCRCLPGCFGSPSSRAVA